MASTNQLKSTNILVLRDARRTGNGNRNSSEESEEEWNNELLNAAHSHQKYKKADESVAKGVDSNSSDGQRVLPSKVDTDKNNSSEISDFLRNLSKASDQNDGVKSENQNFKGARIGKRVVPDELKGIGEDKGLSEEEKLDFTEIIGYFLGQKTINKNKKVSLSDYKRYENRGAIPKKKFIERKNGTEKNSSRGKDKQVAGNARSVPKILVPFGDEHNGKKLNSQPREMKTSKSSSNRNSEIAHSKEGLNENKKINERVSNIPLVPSDNFLIDMLLQRKVPKHSRSPSKVIFSSKTSENNSAKATSLSNAYNEISGFQESGKRFDIATSPQNLNVFDKNSVENPEDGLPLHASGGENNLGKYSCHLRDYNWNIGPTEEIETLILEKDFDKVLQDSSADTEALKSLLKIKIESLKAALLQTTMALDKLNFGPMLTNLETISASGKEFHDKQVMNNELQVQDVNKSNEKEITAEDLFLLASKLFPESETEYLLEKVKECNDRKDLLEKLLEEEFNRVKATPDGKSKMDSNFKLLLTEYPDYDFRSLFFLWIDLFFADDKLREYTRKQKIEMNLRKIEEALSNHFPDMDPNLVKTYAEDYLFDEEGLKNFIAAEKLRLKVNEQHVIMVSALPENDPRELWEVCNGFKGDPKLVSEYIEEVTRQNRNQTRFLNMQLILPDADPVFLQEAIEKLGEKEDDINRLTYELLSSKEYPKIQQSQVNVEKQRLLKKYLDNFNVKNFLLNVPKAENFLGESSDNNNAELPLVLHFLKSRYPYADISRLEQSYRDRDRNLTGTCIFLDSIFNPVRLSKKTFENQTFSEAFLQEVTFIDHRLEIEKYLSEVRFRKEKERFEARLENAFLVCPLCYNEELIASEAVTCPEGHIFCKDCIVRYVEVKWGDSVSKFSCPLENCNTCFTWSTLEEVTTPLLFLKIQKKQQEEEISEAGVDGLESCIFCEFAYIPNPLDKVFKCQNPECLKETCRKCHQENHIPLRCEEVERSKDAEARKQIEEIMTEKLVRVCPNCKKKIVKLDGCNKIVCVCGTTMCYVCREKVSGYSHFIQGTGYRSVSGKCPLYSNNDVLHTTEVLQAGIQARDNILEQNPDIRILHDPTTMTR